MRPKHLSILERVLLVVMLLPGGIAGCTSASSEPPLPTPRPLGADIPAYRAAKQPTDPQAAPVTVKEPTGTLTLREALGLALMGNPSLAAVSLEIRAAEAEALHAGARPNPDLRVRTGYYEAGKLKASEKTDQILRLGQVFELGGKAQRRRQVARWTTAMSEWDYETCRLDVFAETATAFVAVLVAEKHLGLAEQMHKLAEEAMTTLDKRVKAGVASSLKVARARFELGTSRIELDQARRAVVTARGGLARCWGSGKATFKGVAGDLEALVDVPALEQLLPKVSASPEVARWETEAYLRQATIELEQANGIPDLRVLLGMRRRPEDDSLAYSVAMEIDLPIFDRNQGAVTKARFDRIRATYKRRSAILTAQAELAEAHETLAAAHHEAAVLKSDVLPAAKEWVEAVSKGLGMGAVKYSDVMKARRSLFEAKIQQIEAFGAFHTALVEVERLIAQPITEDAGEPDAPAR